jgi:histidyl-tRNA synthetase
MKFQPPRGTRDFLPEEMSRRRIIFEKIRTVFERYGYGEISTPAFEDFELLAKKSGPEIENEIYAFTDKSGRKLGLRFDPTVPICRIVASDPSLPKPIKFYYITNMWRYDRPGAGRWREFWQAGIELIGSNKPEADAEILAVVYDSLKALGIKDFYFKINSREIIESLAKEAGIPANRKFDAFRVIDKLDKIGDAEVKKEMKDYKIPEKTAGKFLKLIKAGKTSKKELETLEKIKSAAKIMGVDNIKIDFSIVRGIDYYTGFVFETFVRGYEDLGSVASGGRYDSLIGLYGGGNLPATGFGIGVDRLMEILDAEKRMRAKPITKVFVVNVNEKTKNEAMKICQELRKSGINSQADVMGKDMKKQLEYANSMQIPYVLFVGEKELKGKNFTLKNMINGKQESLQIKDVIKRLSLS